MAHDGPHRRVTHPMPHPKEPSLLRRLLASPWVAAVLGVGAPIAGFWVATQSKAIQEATAQIPWLQPPSWTLFGLPGAFWVLVAITVVLGATWVFHKYAEAANVTDRQQAVVSIFENATRLGLSRGLNAFRESVERSHHAFLVATLVSRSETAREKRQSIVAEAIRITLGHTALFARELDAAPSSTVYSAAIFIFHSSAQLAAMPEAQREALLGPARFVFHNELPRDPAQISGVLEMRKELSTRALDPGFGPDPNNPELVLPVPRRDNGFATLAGKERWLGLPGAPYTAFTEQPMPFESIEAMTAWIDDHADLSANVKRRVMSLFDQSAPVSAPVSGGGAVRSYLTLPVVMPLPGDQSDRRLVGVVVIQSSAEGLLADHRYEVFANVSAPLRLYLASLIVMHRDT